MFADRKVIILAMFAVCLGLSEAMPRFRRQAAEETEDLDFLGEDACKIVNGTVETTRTCGCGNQATVECNVGPVSLKDVFGNTISATFCAVAPDWTKPEPFKGVFDEACLISTTGDSPRPLKDDACPAGFQCVKDDSTKSISFSVNGTAAVAYFCDGQLVEQPEEASVEVETPNNEGSMSSESSESSEGSESSKSEEEPAVPAGAAPTDPPTEGAEAAEGDEETCVSLD